ncbi:MAG: LarC family nickel insertion protein [Lachnospiraceae bacterium]|nr:LarC family nickel insertion protein [Lachnospiraceae bacterium]
MNRKSLYFECFSGISGDMAVAALLDLGIKESVIRNTLEQLELPGYEIEIGRAGKNGIDTCHFDVLIPQQPHYDEGHGFRCETHNHTHEKHIHRNLQDITAILDKLQDPAIRELSLEIFKCIAAAEAKAHNKPVEDVHFHEVGAIDSIVDVVSFAACFTSLSVDRVYFSPLYEGYGHVHCQHGILPVPAPATLNILSNSPLHIHLTDTEGEMITPTGAAIASTISSGLPVPEQFRIQKIGMGSGKKEFARANILRVMMIDED